MTFVDERGEAVGGDSQFEIIGKKIAELGVGTDVMNLN